MFRDSINMPTIYHKVYFIIVITTMTFDHVRTIHGFHFSFFLSTFNIKSYMQIWNRRLFFHIFNFNPLWYKVCDNL